MLTLCSIIKKMPNLLLFFMPLACWTVQVGLDEEAEPFMHTFVKDMEPLLMGADYFWKFSSDENYE